MEKARRAGLKNLYFYYIDLVEMGRQALAPIRFLE
jgi:hypothetical protein